MRLIYIALGWCAGVLLALSDWSLTPSAWLVLALSLAVLLIMMHRVRGYRLLIAAILAFGLGGLRTALNPTTSAVAALNNTGGLTIEGVVVDAPDVRDDRIDFRVDVETVERAGRVELSSGRVLVRAPITSDARYGDRVRVTGQIIAPAEYDTFSYADYLARVGVFSIMRYTSVEVLSSGHGSPIYAALLDLRMQAADRIASSLPEPQAGLLTGILLGLERGISPELGDAFAATGAAHIVAISGFNMVIISGVVMGLLERARVKPSWAALFGILVIAVYTIFVGANAAVVRAALMSSLLAVGTAVKRKTFVPTSLALVALVLSALNPPVLLDVSFQLSFFATLGLALFTDPLAARFDGLLLRLFPEPFARSAGRFLSEPLVVTLAALITTLPLTVMYFSRLSLVVVAVNLLIVPVQAVLLMTGGIATMLAFVLPPVAQLLYWFCMLFLTWSIEVVRTFASLPFAQVDVTLDPRLVFAFLAGLIGWTVMQAAQPDWWLALGRVIRRRSVIFAALFSAFGILALTAAVLLSRPNYRTLDVWFLDVGHSNAVLMQTPGGVHMLVDGGRFPSRLLTAIGDRLPFYDRDIDVLFITQPDVFQFGALPAVLARYNTGIVLQNGQDNLSEAYIELQEALADRQVMPVTAGYTLDVDDGVRVEVLHPQRQPELGEHLGEGSLVLRISYGEISFLLTSQVNVDGQVAILDSPHWPLATVMQMPHHGASRSLDSDFLAAVQPQAVVLQSDRANLLGHPHGDTLAMLGEIPLYRTDQNGVIHFWTDGQQLWVQTQR
jgi:competence protein ComEC